jgi:transcription factor SFP1
VLEVGFVTSEYIQSRRQNLAYWQRLTKISMIMTGTSPFTIQSPSYHSSSYLPKLEANFMRDFSCCGITLASLHDLLQHYEEAHASKSTQPLQRPSPALPTSGPDSRAALATGAAAAVQQQAQLQQQQQSQNTSTSQGQNLRSSQRNALGGLPTPTQANALLTGMSGGLGNAPIQPEDLDAVEDMEMDDGIGETETTPPPQLFQQSRMQPVAQSSFGQQNPNRVAPLNMNLMQTQQGLRHSQPTTPVNPGRPGFTNPTVSSVNTPTFGPHPLQHQQATQYRSTPDSSNPGTPGELDGDLVGGLGDMSMYSNALMPQAQGQTFGFGGFGNSDMVDLYIDEPAKRLFSPNGGFNNQQQAYAQMRLGAGSQYGPNSEVARRIREQQMLAGVPDTSLGMMPNEEPKPFRCPVIGCEKAYKNQNGLKYHKTVSTQVHHSYPETSPANFRLARPQQPTTS